MKVPGLKEILKTAFFIEHLWWLLLNISQCYTEFLKLENRYQLMSTLLPLRVISNRSNWPNIWLRFDSIIKFSIWQTKSFIFRFDIKFLDSWIFKQHHGWENLWERSSFEDSVLEFSIRHWIFKLANCCQSVESVINIEAPLNTEIEHIISQFDFWIPHITNKSTRIRMMVLDQLQVLLPIRIFFYFIFKVEIVALIKNSDSASFAALNISSNTISCIIYQ